MIDTEKPPVWVRATFALLAVGLTVKEPVRSWRLWRMRDGVTCQSCWGTGHADRYDPGTGPCVPCDGLGRVAG